jgi:hypothetical protein
MTRYPAILVFSLALCGCNQGEAPRDDGVCWQAHAAGAAPVRYTALSRAVGSLEDCAVLLEAARLEGQPDTNGAYQGFYLFIDPDEMTSGTRLDGFRYPVLQPPQRAEIDRELRRIMAQHGGKIPADADLSLVRQ